MGWKEKKAKTIVTSGCACVWKTLYGTLSVGIVFLNLAFTPVVEAGVEIDRLQKDSFGLQIWCSPYGVVRRLFIL